MPTSEQMQSVIDQIKRYEASSFALEGAFYRECPAFIELE